MDLSPLTRFQKRIDDLKDKQLKLAAVRTARGVAMVIEEYVRETYPDATVTFISIDEKAETLALLIDIHAENLWFREFGTGYVGASSPGESWEYRPTIELSFFSRGQMQHTSGWEYAYHPETQRLGGWWYRDPETGRKTFTEGQVAESGVSKAIIRVKYHGIPSLAEYVRMNMR